MTSALHPKSAAGWCDRIGRISDDRCDLEILLKDEWRHKVAIRDDDQEKRATRQQVMVVGGEDYVALRAVLGDDTSSLGALALATLHSVLHAYGHGNQTVLAFMNGMTGHGPRDGDLLPVIVNHAEQSALTCAEAVARLGDVVRQQDSYVALAGLSPRGLFDALLLLAGHDVALADVPSVPLIGVVRDVEDQGHLHWTLCYAGNLFDDPIIAGVLDMVREVFGQFVHRPARRVGDLELLSEKQRLRLAAWNDTDGDFPADKRLNELLEDAVRQSPGRLAVLSDTVLLTYHELNERSNLLAHWLLGPDGGVRPGELIGFYLDKSELGVITELGIWKAGAAFVPIDPAYPPQQVAFVVSDTGISRIFTNRHHLPRLRDMLGSGHTGVDIVAVESVLEAQFEAPASARQNPRPAGSSLDLAYVTYTSGTTGMPNGVPKDHRSVVNSITDLSERYDMRRAGEERVALFASYVFEPHLRQTLIALINSQTLVIVPDDVRLDPDRLPDYLDRHRVSYLNATGSVLQHFDLGRCRSLTRLMLVGEELTATGLRALRTKFAGRVINEYAFTESAFVTSIKEFAPGVIERPNRSIGRPLRNVKWYVLSQDLKQVPIGAIGELYIGGCGVALGYLNRDDLTAERFSPNPFQTEAEKLRNVNDRLYRTGDLARVLPDGEVDFAGRADFQMKINGVRVEPGEIEAQAMEYPGVRKCVVVAREGAGGPADRHLVGYYTTDNSCDVTEADLLSFLGDRLIRIMVPARMIHIASIPVNVNGKVDRRSLPEVDVSAADLLATRAGLPGDGSISDGLRGIFSDVLGVPVDRVKDGDDFFRLGGHSISCVLLIAKVRQRLGRWVGVEDVFRLRTLGALAEYLRGQPPFASAVAPEPVAADGAVGLPVNGLPANGLQQGLLYHALKRTSGDDAYVMQSVHRYRCVIDPDLMRQAWQRMRRKYPSLRLRFDWADGPRQFADQEDRPVDWRFIDVSDVADPAGRDDAVRLIQQRDRTEPYDPAESNLFRVYLIKQRYDEFSLIFSCHHIILDGWSLPVLHDDVHRVYLRLAKGLPVEPGVDSAYPAAQRYWERHRDEHVAYWTRQIRGIDERGDFAGLLSARSRYQVSMSGYDNVREHRTSTLHLGAELTSALKEVCAASEITLHSVLQFVWHKVLYAIGGGNTTVVGTIVSGRNLPIDAIENSVGLFINTLPLIVNHDEQERQSVADAIAGIQAAVNTMNDLSVVELARLDSGELKHRLFDTLLVLENYPRLLDPDEERAHQDLLLFEKSYDADKVDYPIAVVAREESCSEGTELTITLWYAGELFDDDTIAALLDLIRSLFRQVADDIRRPVRDIEYVTPEMVERFDEWNRTWAPFPAYLTLHAVFEQAAAAWPDQVAVVYRENRMTYRELNEQANRLAHLLRSQVPLAPDDLVGLVLDKNELMIVAILAVWKAGAGYVPIDAGYPDERVAFMLSDTVAKLVVTNEAHAARLRGLPGTGFLPVLEIEGLPLGGQPVGNPKTETTSSDLAYAIYTSGTTGRPKAVLVEHRGVVNLQQALANLFTLPKGESDESFLSFSNYVFDHFVEQMTDALLNGQKLVVLDDTMRADPERLYRYLADEQVTYLSGTPSVLSLYDYSTATSLTRIDAIGEDFTEPVFDKIRRSFPGMVINGYGPTEISITSHKRPYPPGERRVNKSIGLPLANYSCYVLNRDSKRVPVGGLGELHIGGIGVARGYLNRDELTAERFLDNPFQTEDEKKLGINTRVYRTGDLARWLPNGELECLGRTDLQVKIRGQRVELGEIEAALSCYPGITRALVIPREHGTGQKYLVGFYVSAQDLDERDVKERMRTKLPEALVPARILRITDIPVTASGKLDTKRLPQTDFLPGSDVEYVPPATDIEIKLCGIWANVLGIAADTISTRDDFLALGGDSIRAMALGQAISTSFGRTVGVTTVLRHTTIAAQARHIQRAVATTELGLTANVESALGSAADRVDDPPLSRAQERLLFIDEFEGGTAAYNIPFTLRLAATAEQVTAALRTLLVRHPALRTLLRPGADGTLRQHPMPAPDALAVFDIPVSAVNVRVDLDDRLTQRAKHVFRLDAELPIWAALFELTRDPEAVYLSLVIHHIAFDGWSWNIFFEEFAALLGGASPTELPASRGSYAEFARWQRQYLTGRRLSELTEYWVQALEGFETVTLPLDRPRPPRFDYRGRELLFRVDAQTANSLHELARSARVSLYSVLLAGWCLVLNRYTGQRDLVVGTPVANRGQPEFARTIGCFANLLVLRVRVNPHACVPDYIRSVGEAVAAAQIHGEFPFEQLVKELQVPKDPSRHPIVGVNFTLQTTSEEVTESTVAGDYRPDAQGWTVTKFDLSATLRETPDGLDGNLTFAASLFDDESAHGFISAFRQVLAEFTRSWSAAEPASIADIGVLDETGRAALLASAAGEVTAAPAASAAQKLLHTVFEQVARAWPDDVAVAAEGVRLTYRELDERASRLADHLRSVVPSAMGNLVGLVLDKNELTVIAILAVWKAGAGYLPIDPGYPDERVSFMLADAAVRLVVAGEEHAARLRALPGAETRYVVDIERVRLDDGPTTAPRIATTPDSPAYAIYTSGTTGQPKAVLVSHVSVVSFADQVRERYFDDPRVARQAILFLSNYVFDFSVEQLVLAVLGGHTLIIPPPGLAYDDNDFVEYLNREGLSYLSGTPTQIQRFDLARLTHLRCVLVAGEPFQAQHFQRIRSAFAGPVYNAYGTTETTIYNTVKRFGPHQEYRNSLGEPMSNTSLYVLDENMRLLPRGAVGELYIAGECVSDGYLNRPELTAERFLPNPFQTQAQRREQRLAVIYRTGDLVRRDVTGEIQYLGRNDAQVKIRGLRIEPAEVETVLATAPGVRQCAVIARPDPREPGSTLLVGYYQTDSSDDDEVGILRHLRSKLMPGMVPSLVRLNRPLPMTITGKLNTDALPPVDPVSREGGYVAPRNRIEARLCASWGALLPGGAVGIDDDFFQSGGDSISALRLANKVQLEVESKITVKSVFDFPTVRLFAENVVATSHPGSHLAGDTAEQGHLTGECPQLPIQEWFFAKPLADRACWNQTFAIRTPPLDPARLRQAIVRLVEHHDAFRLRYRPRAGPAGEFTQTYAEDHHEIVVHELDVRPLSADAIARRLRAWQRDFDLENGPTWCAAYLRGFGDGSARVWFAVHHLIIDSVSWHILTQDLEIVYHGGDLGPKTASYRQWARAVRAYRPGEAELRFWAEVKWELESSPPNPLSACPRDMVHRERFTLGTAETRTLLAHCPRAYDAEINDLLLTGVGSALRAVTGQDRNYVTVEGHGRELLDGAGDVGNSVGWFTTMYPLPLDVAGRDLRRDVGRTVANRREVPHHGIGYGALFGRYGGPLSPLPAVSFNYLGRLTGAEGGDQREGWRLDPSMCGTYTGDYNTGADQFGLDVTMTCVQGRLVGEVESRCDEITTRRFADELHAWLTRLAADPASAVGVTDVFDPYILVNEQEPGCALFVLPPGEGGAESYLNNLARRLPGHRLVLFNNVHLHSPMKSFEAIADYYVGQIRSQQPSGPYNLLGWSFGGVVALEIALQLTRAGEKIDNLMFIDSYFNVRRASAEIGLPHVTDLLDPINYLYQPNPADLAKLHARTGRVVMFKAGGLNDVVTGEGQRKLFEFYLRSSHHNLDTLLPAESIEVRTLDGETHHTWVQNDSLVVSLGAQISELLSTEY